ncbi:MAG: preprotein translocase subunit SecA [Sorangiineae bacterium]|nr:preprotein translocase subunit SecA [Polyangiaceae bacterium]MEB2324097.1 preprotein translocase subunit SecA [Sorangiineae bacterium]
MLTWFAKKMFGTSNERTLRHLRPKVAAVSALEPKLQKLSDDELKAKTAEFKEKLDNGATLDDLLIEAFAVCREAGKRVLKMRHYDVQLLGGMVLHSGGIAEMRTGEGKTLVATLPVYLNALEGKGVHLVTVNDYLATRDAEWMGRLYNWLGLSIGTIVNQQSDAEKRRSYQSDICYGQNNEFGFDYLRDNMKFSALEYAQRELNFAIVDEVDSILIDEARTPLIISGPADAASEKYRTINEVMAKLRKDEHYSVDEKAFNASFTDDGVELVQKLIGVSNLYDPINISTLHIANQLLRAHGLYKRDQHYMVSADGKVLIIDEFTGRVLPGRRWSDGLHQAVEAKENVRIQEESRTMATITFQNLFRLYKKLGGMTGTAETEAQEFHSTYELDVTVIPTNKPLIREDHQDVVYKTEREKFTAVIKEILEQHEAGRPVLVGTTSVEKSGAISRILKKKKVDHAVLNAKHHENEAFVVAQAGRKGAITVSTNMAGRGTDILLGGNPEMIARLGFKEQGRSPDDAPEEFAELVVHHERECQKEHDEVIELGGLHIVGTERHESRRIDNQLRGRAGRQGDPGSSRFYLSLEDDLMRIFAGDKVKGLMDRMGMPDDEPIEHPWVTKSVENAQRKVEERNFDIRKNLLEYDDVMNAQRKTVYSLRQQLLLGRYSPEEIDELGKPTGHERKVPIAEDIAAKVTPLVGRLVGMFTEPPLAPTGDDGKPRAPTREELEAAETLVELKMLQHEVYQHWGVKLDIEGRKKRSPISVYEELSELVGRGLSEQRERMLDLLDRVMAAIVEESCPANKPPEDWDWQGIRQGFREQLKVKLDKNIEDFGSQDDLVQELYARAEKIYRAKENELGVDLGLRIFRHVYLETIDEAWVDHLSSMEHLRDGIGLRGYGQKDPKNEYKKEGYNLFVNMMARVSGVVLQKFFEVQIQHQEEMEAIEAEDLARHQAQLDQVVARHAGEGGSPSADPDAQLARMREAEASVPPPQRPNVNAAPKIGRNDPCPCGSGKKFKKCHGAMLDEDEGDDVDPGQAQV